MPTASAVIIGDEILSGKFRDENTPFLIAQLRTLGVDLRRISVIPDQADQIAATVADHASTHTFVFTSGGVGPTHDDVTMAGIAQGFGVAIVRHPVLEAAVRDHWGARLQDANLRLAEVPEGTVLIEAEGQRWPVMRCRNVFILPGVPSLFRQKFAAIAPSLGGMPMKSERLYLTCDEGTLARDLTEVAATYPTLQFGSYPRLEETAFRVMITIDGRDAAQLATAYEDLRARLRDHEVAAPVVEVC